MQLNKYSESHKPRSVSLEFQVISGALRAGTLYVQPALSDAVFEAPYHVALSFVSRIPISKILVPAVLCAVLL